MAVLKFAIDPDKVSPAVLARPAILAVDPATDMKEAVSDGTLSAGDAIEDLRRGIEEGTEGVAGSTAKMAGLAKTAIVLSRKALIEAVAEPSASTATFLNGSKPLTIVVVMFRDNTIGAEKVQGVLNSIARSLEGISKSANPLISVVKGQLLNLLLRPQQSQTD
jgi:hypothetical protein